MSDKHLLDVARIWKAANDAPLAPDEAREIRDNVLGLFLLVATWQAQEATAIAG